MAEFTKEQLQKIIAAADDVITALAGTNDDIHHESDAMLRAWDELNDRYAPPKVVAAMAHQLLASTEQEPVAYIDPFTLKNFATYRAGETDNKRMGREWVWANPDAGLIPLYTAPQLLQPAVDECAIFDAAIDICRKSDAIDEHSWNRGVLAVISAFRACRAAMLQGAEPVSQPYTLRDGWVTVPVEPTENMIIAGFEAELREEFRDPEAWEAFEAMSGCEQAAHRAKWCWAAMIAAAPQQEAE